jgi:hypothetical protein
MWPCCCCRGSDASSSGSRGRQPSQKLQGAVQVYSLEAEARGASSAEVGEHDVMCHHSMASHV